MYFYLSCEHPLNILHQLISLNLCKFLIFFMSLILKKKTCFWLKTNKQQYFYWFRYYFCINSRTKKQVYCLCNACCLFILSVKLQINNIYRNPSWCSPLYTFVVINPYLTLPDLVWPQTLKTNKCIVHGEPYQVWIGVLYVYVFYNGLLKGQLQGHFYFRATYKNVQ